MGQASTDSAGCLVSRDLWSCDIGLLSQLPNLEPCEPRDRKGDEQLAAMVPLLRVRWGRRCRRVETHECAEARLLADAPEFSGNRD